MFLVSHHGLSRSIYNTTNFSTEHGVKAYSPLFDTGRWSDSDEYQQGGVPSGLHSASIEREFVKNIRTERGDPRELCYIYGFSAGAQYLCRVAAFYPVPGVKRYVIAGPSTWVWPSDAAAPFGFGGMYSPGAEMDAAIKAYLSLPITVYCGELDNDPEDPDLGDPDNLLGQGTDRLDRAENVYAAAQAAASSYGIPLAWQFYIAPGVGHAGTSMLNATNRNEAFNTGGRAGQTVAALAPVVLASDATVAGAEIVGTLEAALDAATVAAEGDLEVLASLSATLADATVSSAAVAALSASLTATLDDATSDASGALTLAGALAVTLGDATLAATAGSESFAGVDVTLADATLAATAAIEIAGSGAVELADATVAGDAALALVATLGATLEDATLAALGASEGTATVLATLADATLSATAAVDISGAADVTLGAATVSGVGALAIAADLASTLAAATAASSAKVALGASLDASLADATSEATATLQEVTFGTLTATLDAATVSSGATLAIVATAAPSLGDATLEGAATVDLAATSNVTLGGATLASGASLFIVGGLDTELGDASVEGHGVAVVVERFADLSVTLSGATVSSNLWRHRRHSGRVISPTVLSGSTRPGSLSTTTRPASLSTRRRADGSW